MAVAAFRIHNYRNNSYLNSYIFATSNSTKVWVGIHHSYL